MQERLVSIHSKLSKVIESRHTEQEMYDIAFYPDEEDKYTYVWRYNIERKTYRATYHKDTGEINIEEEVV